MGDRAHERPSARALRVGASAGALCLATVGVGAADVSVAAGGNGGITVVSGGDERGFIRITGNAESQDISVVQAAEDARIRIKIESGPTGFAAVEGCDVAGPRVVTCPDVYASDDYLGFVSVELGGTADDLGDQVVWAIADPGTMLDVVGGGGPDSFAGASLGPTSVHGRGGSDTVNARDQRLGLELESDEGFNAAIHGGPGRDYLSGAREARGGGGADILVGYYDDEENPVSAAKTLHGGRGRDLIDPSLGSDVVYGGPGKDEVQVRDEDDDDVNCGRGRDLVRADWRDLVYKCEKVRL